MAMARGKRALLQSRQGARRTLSRRMPLLRRGNQDGIWVDIFARQNNGLWDVR